ncbi:MAG: biotin/lipoyl-containing protein [Acidimicrobiia bacterium]
MISETGHAPGEALLVPERVIVAPAVGVFRPIGAAAAEGASVQEGDAVGAIEGPGTTMPIRSPFAGTLVGMLAHPGERLREGQPVAWLRVA